MSYFQFFESYFLLFLIHSREMTALELADNAEAQAIDIGLGGSNSQLNSGSYADCSRVLYLH